MTLAQRIRAAIDARGVKDVWVATGAGITQTTLSNIVNGHTQDPSVSVVAAIADVLDESVDALLGRPIRPLLQLEQATLRNAVDIIMTRVVPPPNEHHVAMTPIPRRNRRKKSHSVLAPDVAATPERQIFTDVHEMPRREISDDLRSRGVRQVFRVQGESMISVGIQHGDLLYVRTDVTKSEANGKIVVCRVGDFDCVKRLEIGSDGQVRLVSENPKMPTVELKENEANELVVIGIVIAHLSDL